MESSESMHEVGSPDPVGTLGHLPIVIEVNRRPVSMNQHRATGLQIKEAAIAQGVPIEADFLLAVRRHGRTEPIKDHQEVELHDGEHFVANAADDNS